MKKILLLTAILLATVYTNAQCTSGDCENGFGTYVFQGGGTYTGDWKNGKREGKGTFTWTKGDVYIGDWVANAETGSCVYNFANGQKYVGEINNNNYEGEGSFILPNGYYKKGIFKNDVAVTIKYFNDKNIEIYTANKDYKNALKYYKFYDSNKYSNEINNKIAFAKQNFKIN